MRKSLAGLFIVFLVFVVAFSAMANGTSEKSTGGASGGVTQLEFMVWDSTQFQTYKQSIAEFEKSHPNIKVNAELYGWTQYWQKIQTTMAAGTPPDVFWNQIQYFPTFLQNKTIEPLDSYIKKDNVDLTQFDPQLLKIFEYEGKIYTITKDWDTIALIYNKDVFDKLGIAYPDANLSWNPSDGGAFLSLAQKLTIDKNGKNATQAGFDSNSIVQWGTVSVNTNQPFYWNFMLMNGGGYQTAPWSNQFLYDNPKTAQAMQFLSDLIYKYHVAPQTSQLDATSQSIVQLLASGKVAMATDGSWDLRSIFENANFKWGIAPLPSGPAGRISVINGIGEAMSSSSQHKDQAWTLMKWFASEDNQKIFGSSGTVWPSRPALDPLFLNYWKTQGVDATPFLDESRGKTALSAEALNWNQIYSIVNKYYSLLFTGSMDATTAGQKIMGEIANIK